MRVSSIDRKLLTPKEQADGWYCRFNVSALLRGDTLSRYNAYNVARTAGFTSVNEIRALEELNPVAGGDKYLEPLNMQATSGATQ